MIHPILISVILIYIIISFNVAKIESAGVLNHFYIASRLINDLPDQVVDFENEYYAGSFHPDAFYDCLGESLAAESSHWPLFLKIAIDYYHKKYTLKGSNNFKLKAFLYGVFTHQVTDVAWHSLNTSQGLLKMLSEVEFNGDYQRAHNFLDTAGDFIILDKQFENLSDNDFNLLVARLRKRWDYPIEDIIEIYHNANFPSINKSKLKFCMDRGFSALQGEVTTVIAQRMSGRRINLNLQESPLSSVLINDYFYGGIDQIVNTLKICISELELWFINSTYKNPWDICKPIFESGELSFSDSYYNDKNSYNSSIQDISSNNTSIFLKLFSADDNLFLSSGISNSQFGSAISIGNYLEGPTIAISSPFEEVVGNVYLIELDRILKGENFEKFSYFASNIKALALTKKASFTSLGTTLNFPTKFGDTLYNWNLPNGPYLAISESGICQIKIFLCGKVVAILKNPEANTIIGKGGIKQFNILSDVEFDLNDDGFPDLVIGSMFSDNLHKHEQGGLVIIIDGKKFINYINDFKQIHKFDIPVIDINLLILKIYETPTNLLQNNSYEQFGCSFSTSKNKILIGINSLGSVIVFDKYSGNYEGLIKNKKPYFVPKKDDINFKNRKTSRDTALFGYGKILTGVINQVEWVIISAPAFSYNLKCPSCGIVFFYIIEDNEFTLISKISPFESFDTHKYVNSMFGHNMIKLSENSIIISSSGYNDGQGALFLVNLEELITCNSPFSSAKLFFIPESGVGYTDFGKSMSKFIFEDSLYLAIGLPKYKFDKLNSKNVFSGSVLIKKI